MNENFPKVGIGVIVLKGDEVLLGNRINSHGNNTWCFPGGHLELFEEIKNCALREVKEETGLKVEIVDTIPVATTNDFFNKENKHYVTLFVRAKYIEGNPEIMEPEKCKEWKWFEWNKFPENIFEPIKNLIRQEYNPFTNLK
ncbi:MAG: NUDIX hydrolase [archaeon]